MNNREIIGQLPKDLREYADMALDKGWTLEKLKNNHIRWHDEKGNFVTVTASTPSDYRAVANEIAALKRGGLLEETVPPKEIVSISAPSLVDTIREYFSANPQLWVTLDTLRAYLTENKIAYNDGALFVTVSKLAARGVVTRVGRGAYKLASATPTPEPTPPPAPAPEPTVVVGRLTGDARLDEELKKLETALGALAEIEGVVLRITEIVNEIAAFKKRLMGG